MRRRSKRMSNVMKFGRRRRRPRQPTTDRRAMVAVVVLAVFGVAMLGQVLPDKSTGDAAAAVEMVSSSPTGRRVHFEMCGRVRHTCVVDGDTIWLDGENLRLESYDTPEPYTAICGGKAEVALAKRASARLLELLNTNAFTLVTGGLDGTGERTLATIRIDGRAVGDILVAEGLARRWPDGDEWWCR